MSDLGVAYDLTTMNLRVQVVVDKYPFGRVTILNILTLDGKIKDFRTKFVTKVIDSKNLTNKKIDVIKNIAEEILSELSPPYSKMQTAQSQRIEFPLTFNELVSIEKLLPSPSDFPENFLLVVPIQAKSIECEIIKKGRIAIFICNFITGKKQWVCQNDILM